MSTVHEGRLCHRLHLNVLKCGDIICKAFWRICAIETGRQKILWKLRRSEYAEPGQLAYPTDCDHPGLAHVGGGDG